MLQFKENSTETWKGRNAVHLHYVFLEGACTAHFTIFAVFLVSKNF